MLALYLLIAVGTLFYVFQRYKLSYWSRNGFPSVSAFFLLGNMLEVVLRRCSFGIHVYNLYNQTIHEPLLVGLHFFLRPALLIKDAKLVQRILITDFDSFHDRGTFNNPEVDPLSGHMFNMRGGEWRAMRAKLTPAFTTGKLRSMMSTILLEGDKLQVYLAGSAKRREVVQFKGLLDRYALNIIANVGFGIDVDSINNPDHELTKIGNIHNGPGLMNSARLLFAFLCPAVLEFFRTHAICHEALDYFREMTSKSFEHRERNNIVRKDFVQLLLQLRNTGKVGADGDWDIGKGSEMPEAAKSLTIDECAAQTFLFYLAGFDTSSSALAYTLYELVRNPSILKKLQQEIDETLERHGGEITYDAIQEMAYLEMCISESVRKYPTLPIVNRVCTRDYKVPDTDLIIPKGTAIVISLLGMGRDERYFPEPERFYPERFAPDNKLYDKDAFIPFGEGPRMCIGLRLGKIVAKVGLVQLLRAYDFECVSDAEIDFQNFSVTLMPKGGIEIRIKERQAVA